MSAVGWVTGRGLIIVLMASAPGACRTPPPPPAAEQITVWRPLGAWSGRGTLQTDAFISDTGQLRITWELRSDSTAGAAALRIAVHSAVSGRLLAVAVDHRGTGRDVAYVVEDPRSFFLVIEAAHADWSVAVAEGVAATRTTAAP